MQKRIRSAEQRDAQALVDIYAPFVLESATSFEAAVPTVSEMEQRINAIGKRYPWLVFEGDGKVLGYAYASPHRERKAYQWCVEVSVYIHGDVRNRGVGRVLYSSLFEILRMQGYVNVYANVTLPNPASIRLHKTMGFQRIGVYSRVGFKLGKWHDVVWFQLRISEPSTPVPEPNPIQEVLGNERIRAALHEWAQTVKVD